MSVCVWVRWLVYINAHTDTQIPKIAALFSVSLCAVQLSISTSINHPIMCWCWCWCSAQGKWLRLRLKRSWSEAGYKGQAIRAGAIRLLS